MNSKKMLPYIDDLWNFSKANESESKFRALLPQAKEFGNVDYVVELHSQIARAEGLQAKFEEGHISLDEAEALLKVGMERAKVRVLLERGRLHNSSKKVEKSLPIFEEAMNLAIQANEENLAVDAAHMLAIVAPKKEERLAWNLRALEMAKAAKDVRAQKWRGSLLNNIGYFYLEEKKFSKSMDMFQKLLSYCSEQGDEDFANVARWFIAKILRHTDRLDEALAGQMELLNKNSSNESPDAYVLEELGEIHLALGNDKERKSFFQLAYDTFQSDDRYVYEIKFEKERLARIKELGKI